MFYAHVTMLCASVGLAWKVVRPPHMKFEHFIFVSFALLALSAPVFQALGQNQPQILTLFLVLLAFERYRAGSFAMAGMILAVAAAFKLSPLFLVLIFILERNGRATVAFVATGLSLALMSLALAGWPMHLRFLELIGEIDNVIILSNTNYAPRTSTLSDASHAKKNRYQLDHDPLCRRETISNRYRRRAHHHRPSLRI
jgi:alpha-1,2-mannosyltransferase